MMRRGFLAMLGLGPVASLISQHQSSNIPEVAVRQSGSILSYSNPMEVPEVDHSWEKDMFQTMTTDKSGWIETKKKELVREFFRGYRSPTSIDPDIRAMKSFSESAKMRLQIQREAEKSYEETFADISARMKSRLFG
jgi:hypothetical protein